MIVGNHTQMHGPIIGELYFSHNTYTWCAEQMMHLKEVPAYAYADFWSHKPRYSRWFYKGLSYIIAPFAACVFNKARTIAVYHDKRVVATLRESVKRMDEGANILIFPEHNQPYNRILCDFQKGFVDLARIYHKHTGRELQFVPMYVAPALHEVHIGEPVSYEAGTPIKEERGRICATLMERITEMAEDLPRHRVVPYNNLPKKAYPYSKESAE